MNSLDKRICVKNAGSFQSVNLEYESNLENDTFYLFPIKEFNFKNTITSLLEINWENPPEEINYIIEKGKFWNRYDFQILDFKSGKSRTFFHNAKIGLTISIIFNFPFYYYANYRIAYIDINYLYNNSINKRKSYFLYFLNLFFLKMKKIMQIIS